MNHPMLTYAVMQARQDDLARDLRRHQMRAQAKGAQAASAGRPGLSRRFAAYVARRPNPTATQVASSASS